MSNFPNNYSVPTSTSGSYMTLEDVNNIRILKAPVIGQQYWVELEDGTRKPKRVKLDTSIDVSEISINKYGNLSLSHWHGYVVFDYADSSVKVLNVTQKSIQKAIVDLDKNEDWGDITKYDIRITRDEDGKGYTVTPKPPKPLTKEQQEIVDNTYVNLEALYVSEEHPYGGNPFEKPGESVSSEDLEDIAKEIL